MALKAMVQQVESLRDRVTVGARGLKIIICF